MSNTLDIAVIGGGASGLMAAIAAANETEGKIAILERQDRVGRKLLATGNGRCNFTNLHTDQGSYQGGDSYFINSVFKALNVEDTLEYFRDMGLLFRQEPDGRIYPRSGQANSVLDVLRLEIACLGVECLCGFEVDKLFLKNGLWHIQGGSKEVLAKKVILAGGGKASPDLGGTDKGLGLAAEAGHLLVPIFPSISPIKVASPSTKGLKGIRSLVEIWAAADGKLIKKEKGELQFNETGLSGICVFNLSRLAGEYFTHGTVLGVKCTSLKIVVDLMPEYQLDQILKLLFKRQANYSHTPLDNLMTGIFPKRLGEFLVKEVYEGSLNQPCSNLTRENLIALAKLIKNLEFIPAEMASWTNAQICAGGVDCGELNPLTLESLLRPGLYLAGEIIDVDAPCGGFNLQWAWSSGYLAGKSAALALKDGLEYPNAQSK